MHLSLFSVFDDAIELVCSLHMDRRERVEVQHLSNDLHFVVDASTPEVPVCLSARYKLKYRVSFRILILKHYVRLQSQLRWMDSIDVSCERIFACSFESRERNSEGTHEVAHRPSQLRCETL